MSSLLNVSSLNGPIAINIKQVEGLVSHLEKVLASKAHLLSKNLWRKKNLGKNISSKIISTFACFFRVSFFILSAIMLLGSYTACLHWVNLPRRLVGPLLLEPKFK